MTFMNLANLTKLRSRPVTIRVQLLGLVLAIMVPTAALITFILIDSVKTAIQDGIEDVTRTAVLVANEIGQDIEDARNIMEQIAALPSVKKVDPANCEPAFHVLAALYPLYDRVELHDARGRIVCSFPDANPINPQQAPPCSRKVCATEASLQAMPGLATAPRDGYQRSRMRSAMSRARLWVWWFCRWILLNCKNGI
jgi:hypothetical protein